MSRGFPVVILKTHHLETNQKKFMLAEKLAYARDSSLTTYKCETVKTIVIFQINSVQSDPPVKRFLLSCSSIRCFKR